MRFRRTLLLDARASNITIAENRFNRLLNSRCHLYRSWLNHLGECSIWLYCVSVCDLHPDFVWFTVSCPLRYDKYVFWGLNFMINFNLLNRWNRKCSISNEFFVRFFPSIFFWVFVYFLLFFSAIIVVIRLHNNRIGNLLRSLRFFILFSIRYIEWFLSFCTRFCHNIN